MTTITDGSGTSKTVTITTPEADNLPLALPGEWRWTYMITILNCFKEEKIQF